MGKYNSRKLAVAIAVLTAIQSNSASPTVKVVCQAVVAGLYVIVQGYVDAKSGTDTQDDGE